MSVAQQGTPLQMYWLPAHPHPHIVDDVLVPGHVVHAISGHFARHASSATQAHAPPMQCMQGAGGGPLQPAPAQVLGSTVPSGHTHAPFVHTAFAGK